MIGGVGCALLVLSGCAAQGDPRIDVTTIPVPAGVTGTAEDGTVLVVGNYDRTGGRMEALIMGELGISDEECVTVGRNTLVAPKGSGFTPDGRLFINYVGEFAIGDPIPDTGGGYITYASGTSRLPSGYDQCGEGEWAVLNP